MNLIENLLLETDSPVDYEGKAAEPADVRKTLEAVAKIEGVEAGRGGRDHDKQRSEIL